MANKPLSMLRAAGGQISLHSSLGRHFMRTSMVALDSTALPSSAKSVAGEQSLHSRFGRFILRRATAIGGIAEFNSVGGEVALRTPLGKYLTEGI